jgi:hypothetical protein
MAIGLVSNDRGATLQRQLRESNDFDTYLNLTMSLDDIYQHKTQIFLRLRAGECLKNKVTSVLMRTAIKSRALRRMVCIGAPK